jgi:hypothetical protein
LVKFLLRESNDLRLALVECRKKRMMTLTCELKPTGFEGEAYRDIGQWLVLVSRAVMVADVTNAKNGWEGA